MLNPQNETNDITDTLNGSLTTWYSNVDSALKASECVPGYYEYAQAPSYGTQCPVQEGGSTRIDIAGSRFDIISLDNSYIDVEFEVPIGIPQINRDANSANTDGQTTEEYVYYVGFKSAFVMQIVLIQMDRIQKNMFTMLVSNLHSILSILIEYTLMVILFIHRITLTLNHSLIIFHLLIKPRKIVLALLQIRKSKR